MLSERQIKSNLKQWGFNTYAESITQKLNKGIQNFVENKGNKCAKDTQNGGRISNPSEWYGIDSGKYSADVASKSLDVTNDFIRPPLLAHDPTNAIVGGGKRLKLSNKVIDEATNSTTMTFSRAQKNTIKNALESQLTEIMSKIARKNKNIEHLSLSAFNEVFDMKKYAALH